jgi:hypothetical protein
VSIGFPIREMMNDPPPYPATASPTASPRRSGNHLERTGIGVAYPNPLPIPRTAPMVRYRKVKFFVYVARIHPRLNSTEPVTETQKGPFLSCSRPATMKLRPKTNTAMVKTHEVCVRVQPNSFSRGKTKMLHA